MPFCAGERHVHRSEASSIGGESETELDETKRHEAKALLPARPWKPCPSSVTTVSPEKTPACGSTEKTVGGT